VTAADRVVEILALDGTGGTAALAGMDAVTFAGAVLGVVTTGPEDPAVVMTAVELVGAAVAPTDAVAFEPLAEPSVTMSGGAAVLAAVLAAVAGLPEVEFPSVTLATEGLEPGITLCVCGMLPEPGVPMPGKTVPCCRLPNFGCVVEGAAAVVVVASGG
jgi:hypothetical protein